jgi:ABC-type amino acid transport substrate-binding protein
MHAPAGLTQQEKDWLSQKGTLRVGAFKDYAPFGLVDEAGQPVGISVDYWRLVAGRLGVKVAFTSQLFAAQLDGLRKGRFDSLAGIFALEERRKWFDFSRTYTVISTRMYVRADLKDRTTAKSLKGLKVAVVAGDSSEEIAREAGLTTVVFASYPQVVRSLGTGAAQVLILEEMEVDYYLKEFGFQSEAKAVGKPVAEGRMSMPVLRVDTVLLGILDKGIEAVGDSEWEGIWEKWMGQ